MVKVSHIHSLRLRAVRGATTVVHDDTSLVHDATKELLTAILTSNHIEPDEIISAVFTATPDIRSAFPAAAARELGWTDIPMLCATEIDVPNAQPFCIRVLLHVEREATLPQLRPVYLREAVLLRQDLVTA